MFTTFSTIIAATGGIPNSVLAIAVGGMATGILVSLIVILIDARTKRLRNEIIRIALEKGVPVPPELLDPRERAPRPRDDRRTGFIFIAISLGIFTFLALSGLSKFAYVAAIPGCIGIALLLNWSLDRKSRDEAPINGPQR